MEKKLCEALAAEMLKQHNCKSVKELKIPGVTNKDALFTIEFARLKPKVLDKEVWLVTASDKEILEFELTQTTLQLLGLEANSYSKDSPEIGMLALQDYIAKKCNLKTFPSLMIQEHNVYLLKASKYLYGSKELPVSSSYGFVSGNEWLLNALGYKAKETEAVSLGGMKFHITEDATRAYQKLKTYNCVVSYKLKDDKVFMRALSLLGYKPAFWKGDGKIYGSRDGILIEFDSKSKVLKDILYNGVCYSWYPKLQKYFPVLLPENTPVWFCKESTKNGIHTSLIAGLTSDIPYLEPVLYMSPIKAYVYMREQKASDYGMQVFIQKCVKQIYPKTCEKMYFLEPWQTVCIAYKPIDDDIWFHTKDFERLLVAYHKLKGEYDVLMHAVNNDAMAAIGQNVKYSAGVSPITLAIAYLQGKKDSTITHDYSYEHDTKFTYVHVNDLREW